jgi:hypothetical protein
MAEPPPQVTVAGGPPPASTAPRRQWTGRRRAVLAGALAVLLLGYVGSSVHATARRRAAASRAAAARAEGAAVRLTVTGAATAPPQRGLAGQPVQDALVLLELRNSGRVDVRVVGTTLDGTPAAAAAVLPAGRTATVPVTWRIRCAEVGELPGPRILDVHVRARYTAHQVRIRLPFVPRLHLPPGKLATVFHRAAVAACDVLVPPKE